ncbi:MAG: hypothetical protein LBF87_07465 [Treponema sp.]|jgi:hypothetical protein|nr:hypothetical protein [Treponema sp.]
MKSQDWVPKREQSFVDLCLKWVMVLADAIKIAAFGWDQTEVTATLDKVNGFLTARNAYEADNSTTKRLAKDEAKKEAINAIRNFANSSIRFNKKMDDTDKLFLGIYPKDATPTRHNPPTSQPITVVENSVNHFEHKVKAVSHANGDTTKPEDAYGVRYAWQVGGVKPASGADLSKVKFSRKPTLVVTHTEADKGQAAYYASCYENSRGEAGPWSPVEEAFIS